MNRARNNFLLGSAIEENINEIKDDIVNIFDHSLEYCEESVCCC